MTHFEGVLAPFAAALTERGYDTLTPVQEAVLDPALGNQDALVSAQTGSGKTVGFGLAMAPTMLEGATRFERGGAPKALVVAPTRELALQVMRELEWLYKQTGAQVASCVGGMDMRTERRNLSRGVHIVVGTPGRLRDHIERGSLDTSGFRAVVLDEADEMLDMGFRDDLEYILDSAPEDRRTLMFSATVPKPIVHLAKRYQKDAVRISTKADNQQHGDIEYRALTCAPNDRENAIINVLRFYDAKNAIIFCGTRAMVNHMTSRFTNRGFSVVALSGELSQNERSHALQAMRDGRARVCIATDVAARGIDLPNLELVIHADLPQNRDALLHRSGRTGRAGRKGVSVLVVPYNWRKKAERLLQNAKVKADWATPPSVDDILAKDRERIFEDPSLSAELNAEDQAFAQTLLDRVGPERLAQAFLHKHLGTQPAPEELIAGKNVGGDSDKSRSEFDGGVWFRLSVGRKHTAEPRWLLPMLCRAGHITKRDIGSIKIHQTETHVELSPACVDKFLEEIGPSRKVEKSVTIERMAGPPEPPQRTYDKPSYDKPRRERTRAERPRKAPRAIPVLDDQDIVNQFLSDQAIKPRKKKDGDTWDTTKKAKAKSKKSYKPKNPKGNDAGFDIKPAGPSGKKHGPKTDHKPGGNTPVRRKRKLDKP